MHDLLNMSPMEWSPKAPADRDPGLPLDRPPRLELGREAAGCIADAMMLQVSIQLERARPLIIYEVLQTLRQARPQAPKEEVMPLPRWAPAGPARKQPLRSNSSLSACFPAIPEGMIASINLDEMPSSISNSEQTGNEPISGELMDSQDTKRGLDVCKSSKCSSVSKTSRTRRNKMARAAMSIHELSDMALVGRDHHLDQVIPSDCDHTPHEPPMRIWSSRHSRQLDMAVKTIRKEAVILPRTVSGAWRRQARVLAEQLQEDMAEEVAMAKTNFSFRGGLWWLRHLVGLRGFHSKSKFISMVVVLLASVVKVVEAHARLEGNGYEPWMSYVLNFGMLASAVGGLAVHHLSSKISDSSLPPGEQDGLLRAHSVGLGYVKPWLMISKRNGGLLGATWLCSIASIIATRIYKTQNIRNDPGERAYVVTSGVLGFIITSGIICGLCMRVVHICSAMKTSVIRYMQDLASEDLEFEGMAANWNTIQIFIRTLCDGCSYTLTAVSLVIPVLGAGAAFQIHYVDSSWLDVLFSVLPFATVSAMPMLCLYIAADLTQQCEQAPQVANSMLVSEWDTPMAQDLLAFMSRCQIGFYVNDMRVSPAAVMKFTYVLVAIFFTIISWKAESML
ncbi:unnamed protein product [Effrenium voratum]|uniref:Uncharacterized protein n=1 Tax=Effrenium voratum TaxID=2562239 RepID=A0AA36NK36_9DINO|nr:unnamed protein product [Effrenium voratum]CAJ1429983.1 unnamed protein product [Effrenium voratum]